MSKWEEKRLGEVIKVNAETLSLKTYCGEIQYIDISSVNQGVLSGYKIYDINEAPSRARRIIRPNDIIYSTVRPNLKAYYYIKDGCPKNAIASTGFVAIRATEKSDSRFIYYLITEKSFVNYLSMVAKGSAYPAVDTEDFKKAKIKLPLLSIQQKIADILSAYDDLIENNNRRIQLLEKSAQNLYKEWFVRFSFPNYKKTKFEKGLPQGWMVVKLGDVVNIIDGDRGSNYPKHEDFLNEGYCLFLNTGNVTQTGFDFSNSSFINKEKDERLRKGKLQRNDIVITTRGTVGNIALFSEFIKYNEIRINSGMVIIREKTKKIPVDFLYSLLKSEYMKKSINLYSSGSAQPQLPIKDMRKIKLIVPSEDLIKRYSEIVYRINNLVSNLQSQNRNLIKQRDLLLPRLMSGKLKV